MDRNTAEDYIKAGWPVSLYGKKKRDCTAPLRSIQALAANRRFRPDATGVKLCPEHAGLIAMRCTDFHEGAQALVNIWRLTSADKVSANTTRIEGPDGENTWLWRLPPEAVAKQKRCSSRWRQIAPTMNVVHSGHIFLPPTEDYLWADNKPVQILPRDILLLTGMFQPPALANNDQAKYFAAVNTGKLTPQSILRVLKGRDIMFDNRLNGKYEDYFDCLADVFDRFEQMTPDEGLLVYSLTAPTWIGDLTSLPMALDFVARYKDREKKRKKDTSEKLSIGRNCKVEKTIGNAALIARELYGNALYTDIRNGDYVLDGTPVDDNTYTRFQIKAQEYKVHFGYSLARAAVKYVAAQTKDLPPLRWINRVEWDGVPRIDGLLTHYLGADPTKSSEQMSRWFFMQALYILFSPAAAQDYKPVFVGSAAHQLLAALGGEHTGELMSSLSGNIRNKWLVTFNADDISSRLVKFMEKKYVNDYPRRFLLIGHSHSGLLSWQIEALHKQIVILPVKKLNEGLSADVGQLWAEALFAYRSGERPQLSATVKGQASKLCRQTICEDAWFKPVSVWAKRRFLIGVIFDTQTLMIKCLGVRNASEEDIQRAERIMRAIGAHQLKSGDWHG